MPNVEIPIVDEELMALLCFVRQRAQCLLTELDAIQRDGLPPEQQATYDDNRHHFERRSCMWTAS